MRYLFIIFLFLSHSIFTMELKKHIGELRANGFLPTTDFSCAYSCIDSDKFKNYIKTTTNPDNKERDLTYLFELDPEKYDKSIYAAHIPTKSKWVDLFKGSEANLCKQTLLFDIDDSNKVNTRILIALTNHKPKFATKISLFSKIYNYFSRPQIKKEEDIRKNDPDLMKQFEDWDGLPIKKRNPQKISYIFNESKLKNYKWKSHINFADWHQEQLRFFNNKYNSFKASKVE